MAHRLDRGGIGAQPEPSGDRRKLPFRIVEHVLRPHAQDPLRRQPCEEAHDALVDVEATRRCRPSAGRLSGCDGTVRLRCSTIETCVVTGWRVRCR